MGLETPVKIYESRLGPLGLISDSQRVAEMVVTSRRRRLERSVTFLVSRIVNPPPKTVNGGVDRRRGWRNVDLQPQAGGEGRRPR